MNSTRFSLYFITHFQCIYFLSIKLPHSSDWTIELLILCINFISVYFVSIHILSIYATISYLSTYFLSIHLLFTYLSIYPSTFYLSIYFLYIHLLSIYPPFTLFISIHFLPIILLSIYLSTYLDWFNSRTSSSKNPPSILSRRNRLLSSCLPFYILLQNKGIWKLNFLQYINTSGFACRSL